MKLEKFNICVDHYPINSWVVFKNNRAKTLEIGKIIDFYVNHKDNLITYIIRQIDFNDSKIFSQDHRYIRCDLIVGNFEGDFCE